MSIRHPNLLACLVGAFLAALCGTGCQDQSSPEAIPVSAQMTPEKSFEEIVNVLREGLEMPGGQASGFVTSSSSARSRFQVHNTVTSKLLAPATPDEPYRGLITISTQSIYSLRKSAEQEESDKKNGDQNSNRGSGLLDESAESGHGFNTFDESLVTESPAPKQPGDLEIESVQRRADRINRECELIYRNDQWELLTKLNPETEASIQNAFDRALRLQP